MKKLAISLRAVIKRNRKRTKRPMKRTYSCGICGGTDHNVRTHEHATFHLQSAEQ